MGTAELTAILEAYKQVMLASWPETHPAMLERSRGWRTASEAALRAELDAYLAEASKPSCRVRIFWKLAPDFAFGGCNAHFAGDAGILREELIGMTDFDRRLPWRLQAAKYRADDEGVFRSGEPNLDFVERQQSSAGITWVRTGKAPIRTSAGAIIGVLGMYELLSAEEGPRLYGEQSRRRKGQAGGGGGRAGQSSGETQT